MLAREAEVVFITATAAFEIKGDDVAMTLLSL